MIPLFFLFALISQLIFANGSGIFLSIMSVVVLDIFIRLVYQCCIYMKTDLYYVFENVSGCYNLMENAQQMIKRWFPFLKTHITEEVVFEGERKTVFAYSIFYFVGVALTVSLYIIFYIPAIIVCSEKSYSRLLGRADLSSVLGCNLFHIANVNWFNASFIFLAKKIYSKHNL